jgi:hypothetical protein
VDGSADLARWVSMGLDASNARFEGTVLFPIITFGATGPDRKAAGRLRARPRKVPGSLVHGLSDGAVEVDRWRRSIQVLFSSETSAGADWVAPCTCRVTSSAARLFHIPGEIIASPLDLF